MVNVRTDRFKHYSARKFLLIDIAGLSIIGISTATASCGRHSWIHAQERKENWRRQ